MYTLDTASEIRAPAPRARAGRARVLPAGFGCRVCGLGLGHSGGTLSSLSSSPSAQESAGPAIHAINTASTGFLCHVACPCVVRVPFLCCWRGYRFCTAANTHSHNTQVFLPDSHKQDPRTAQNKNKGPERGSPFWAKKMRARPPRHCVLSCDTAGVSPSADARLSAAIYRLLAL